MLSRLSTRLHAAYLRWLLRNAESDAAHMQAEILSGPDRLAIYRAHVKHLRQALAQLEATHAG
jgi:hypothetical protein